MNLMPTLKIDIVSDVACPWCAIGLRRLESAMCTLVEDGLAFDLEWHPFELNPDMPAEGDDIVAHLSRKYASNAAEMVAAQERIMSVARDFGLNFEGALRRRAVNTFDAHRVLMWAGEQARETEFQLALFDAYFGRAENPSDPEVLRRIARDLGLDVAAVDEILASARYAAAVRKEQERFRRADIHSVPTFIIDGRYLIPGAQEPRVFVSVLRKIAAERATDA